MSATNRYITREDVGDWVSNPTVALRSSHYLPYDHRLIPRDDGRIYDVFAKDYGNNDKYITEQDFIFPFVYFTDKYSNGLHSTGYVCNYKGTKPGGQQNGWTYVEFGYLDWDNSYHSINNSNLYISSTWKTDNTYSDSLSIMHDQNEHNHKILITSSGKNNPPSCVYTYAIIGLRMPDNSSINKYLSLVCAKYPTSVTPPQNVETIQMVTIKLTFSSGAYVVLPDGIYAINFTFGVFTKSGSNYYYDADLTTFAFNSADDYNNATSNISNTGIPLVSAGQSNVDYGRQMGFDLIYLKGQNPNCYIGIVHMDVVKYTEYTQGQAISINFNISPWSAPTGITTSLLGPVSGITLNTSQTLSVTIANNIFELYPDGT